MPAEALQVVQGEKSMTFELVLRPNTDALFNQ